MCCFLSIPFLFWLLFSFRCSEWNGNAEEYAKLGIQQVVVETIDYTAPELEQAEQAVGAMQEFLKSNPEKKVASKRQQTTRVELIRKQIYVHCKAGRGLNR